MTSKERFKKVIFPFLETYGIKSSGSLLRLWWNVLELYSDDQVEGAVVRLMRGGDDGYGKPTVTDICREIEGTRDERAAIAWSLLTRAITQHGSWESVCFPEYPQIHSVVMDLGGWTTLCAMLLTDLERLRPTFMKLFTRRMTEAGTHPAYLPGRYEASLIEKGETPVPPTPIRWERKEVETVKPTLKQIATSSPAPEIEREDEEPLIRMPKGLLKLVINKAEDS